MCQTIKRQPAPEQRWKKSALQSIFLFSLFWGVIFTSSSSGLSQQRIEKLKIIMLPGPIKPPSPDSTEVEVQTALRGFKLESNLMILRTDTSRVRVYGAYVYKLQPKFQWLIFSAYYHNPERIPFDYDRSVNVTYSVQTEPSSIPLLTMQTDTAKKNDGQTKSDSGQTLRSPNTELGGKPPIEQIRPSTLRLNISEEFVNESSSLNTSALFELKLHRKVSLLGGYGYSFLDKPASDYYPTLSGTALFISPDKKIHSIAIGGRYYFTNYDDQVLSIGTKLFYGLSENYRRYAAMFSVRAFTVANTKVNVEIGYWYHHSYFKIPSFNSFGDAFEREKKFTDRDLSVGINWGLVLF